LAWTLVATAVVFAFGTIPNRRRARREEDVRVGRIDRRTTSRDRRIGLPDTRTMPIERRKGPRDRRGPAAMA
jgi:hypothetical protein